MCTATVNAASPGSGTPTGTGTFYDGSTTLRSASLGGTGTASFTTSSLSVGSHSIQVSYYGGDADFKASTSAVLKQVVQAAASNVTIASVNSPNAQAITVLPDDSSADLLLHDQALEQVWSRRSLDLQSGDCKRDPGGLLEGPGSFRIDVNSSRMGHRGRRRSDVSTGLAPAERTCCDPVDAIKEEADSSDARKSRSILS